MNVSRMLSIGVVLGMWFASASAARGQEKKPDELMPPSVAAARAKGLDWLTKNQVKDGSWGNNEKITLVTGLACLAYLSAADEPFEGARGKALVKGLSYLMSRQDDGLFESPKEGAWWTYTQAFATLALSEAFGRATVCKIQPDMDLKKVRNFLQASVRQIEQNQKADGDWPYTQHCVQAIVSASNQGIKVNEEMLAKGFAHLKQCQNKDGGFSLNLEDRRSQNEATCGALATLGLMQKFDFPVMVNGYQFLVKATPQAISQGHCPYYGHLYGTIGMHLLGQEYKEDQEYRTKTAAYAARAMDDLLAWQEKDGTWPAKGEAGMTSASYPTAYAVMTLSIGENRLSIFSRNPPRLPRSLKE